MKQTSGWRMDASRSGGDVAFRTPFSEAFDLIQVFRGLQSSNTERNDPVDFRLAGLQRRGNCDIWHIDRALAFSTDECSPMVINDEDIGGNHGHPCGVRICMSAHGKDLRDVGSLWQDDAGMQWTLLRIISEDQLLFISENTGASKERYAFAGEVCGKMHYVGNGLHEEMIHPEKQYGGEQLTPAIRHIRREARGYRDGCWYALGYEENLERAEIHDVYEIVNPSTVAQAIRDGRPANGYPCQPSLAAGEAMMRHEMVYHIHADGTVLCCFDHEMLQDVPVAEYLGIMYQEKCDAFGGGVWRCIPGTLPFEEDGITYDFSRPVCITGGPFPKAHALTVKDWANPSCPPSRQVELLRNEAGCTQAAFAAGFLPVDDGEPARRAAQVSEAATIVASRKTYPTFAGGRTNFLRYCDGHGTQTKAFRHLKGAAYKKYFQPACSGSTVYDIHCGGITYVFMDFHSDVPLCQCYDVPDGWKVKLLERADEAQWTQKQNSLQVTARQGYAVFALQQEE